MKSLSFFLILLSMLVGCSDPVSGQSVRDDGPFQAYERQVTYDLAACEKTWTKKLPNVASCTVNVDELPESFVWHAGRIIDHWEYNDQDWLVDISFYHTQKGYRIDMYGSRADQDNYFQYKVAKKYISSAINDWGRTSFRQIVIRPKSSESQPGEVSLGSVEIVKRNFTIRNSVFLSKCSRTWKNGKCFVDVVNGTNRESLLEGKLINLNWGDLFLRATGFKAWGSGSGLSDYMVYIGTQNTKASFAEFINQWKRNVPDLNIPLTIQKFSKMKPTAPYSEQFLRHVLFEYYSLSPEKSECQSTFQVNSDYQSQCRMQLPKGTLALAERELINARVEKNSQTSTVWARVDKYEVVVDILGNRNTVSDFKNFWEILLHSVSENLSQPILLMRIDHQ